MNIAGNEDYLLQGLRFFDVKNKLLVESGLKSVARDKLSVKEVVIQGDERIVGFRSTT